jgi:molybdopterin converting factor small subunit
MKAVITPGFSELFIVVNPAGKITREGLLTINMPWLYAPWPDARETGVIETEVEGDTLRALLGALAEAYKHAGVDFEPISPKTNDMDEDYDVWINDKNYVAIPEGLNTRLKDGDRVKVKILWRWDG